MAVYTAYPTANDVEALLKSAHYWPADSDTTGIALAREQAAISAAAAAAEWENRVGWYPFLAGAAEERFYDCTSQYGTLELDAGILASPAPVLVIAGTTYTVNTQYRLGPQNADKRGKPFTHIKMLYSSYSWPSSAGQISVTAKFGYCSTIPADAWAIIQKAGAVNALASNENLQSIASISQDGFSKALDVVGIITQKDLLTVWGKDFDKAVRGFIRPTV